MVRAKLGREGLADKLKFQMLHSGVSRLYHELKGGAGSFAEDLTQKINTYNISDGQLGISGSVNDLARQYGLERKFDDYIKRNILGGLRGRLAYALDLISSLKDSAEDVAEGSDLVTIILSSATAPIQVPFYLATQTIYTLLAGMLGYTSGVYSFTRRGTFNYLTDTARGYFGALANTVPVLGSLFEISTNLDDKRHRIIEVAQRKAAYWLFNQIREQKRVPPLKSEEDLKSILDKTKPKKAITARLRDYADIFKIKNPIYNDISSEHVYAVV